MEIKKSPKNKIFFYCEKCDFKTSKKSEWDIHIVRPKHLKVENGNIAEKMEIEKISTFICDCKKIYKTNSGLWKHKKNCCYIDKNSIESSNEIKILTNLVLEVVKQNQELINQNQD